MGVAARLQILLIENFAQSSPIEEKLISSENLEKNQILRILHGNF